MKAIKISNAKITDRTSDGFAKYLKEIQAIPLLTPDEESALVVQAFNGDEKAQEELVRKNLRFVVSIAKFYTSTDNLLEDLVNEGNIGLIQASKKFNPEVKARFISYAVWHIRKNIIEYQSITNRLIRLPNNRVNEINRMNKEIAAAQIATNDDVNVLQLDNELYSYLKHLDSTQVYSLDKPSDLDESLSLIDTLPDTMFQSIDVMLDKDVPRALINQALNTLPKKYKEVLIGAYGLNGDKPKSLLVVGKELGLSRERIRQIRKDALIKLKAILSIDLMQELI